MSKRYVPKSHGAKQRSRRIAVYIFVAAVGMACAWVLLEHVLAKNRIATLGAQQRDAERESVALEAEISSLNLRIEEQLSRKNLMKALTDRRTRLRPIQPGTPIPVSVADSASPAQP